MAKGLPVRLLWSTLGNKDHRPSSLPNFIHHKSRQHNIVPRPWKYGYQLNSACETSSSPLDAGYGSPWARTNVEVVHGWVLWIHRCQFYFRTRSGSGYLGCFLIQRKGEACLGRWTVGVDVWRTKDQVNHLEISDGYNPRIRTRCTQQQSSYLYSLCTCGVKNDNLWPD